MIVASVKLGYIQLILHLHSAVAGLLRAKQIAIFQSTMSSPIKLHNKAEVSNTLNPSAGRETSKAVAMGFTSSISVARTTRFKRKLATALTPPATPFNNTSFLMHLQQQRERHNYRLSPTQNSPFDQYGSMDTIIARSFATPASPQNHHNISRRLHPCQSVNACSQNDESSTLEQKGSCSPDGRTCRSESDHRGRVLPHLSCSCSHAACSGITELETPEKIVTDPEMREEDGKSTPRHRHQQHTNLIIDTRAQSPGSGGARQDLACKSASL